MKAITRFLKKAGRKQVAILLLCLPFLLHFFVQKMTGLFVLGSIVLALLVFRMTFWFSELKDIISSATSATLDLYDPGKLETK